MLEKSFLFLVAISFIVYSILVLVCPSIPMAYIGYEIYKPDGEIEFMATYAGMGLGISTLCIYGIIREEITEFSLLAIAMVVGGLGLFRVIGYLTSFGSVSSYTYGTIIFEFFVTLFAVVLFWRTKKLGSSVSQRVHG